MTAELRAALRAAASAWESLGTRAAHPECDSHPLVNPDHCAGHAAALRALADAPPTVAELLAALRSPSLHGRQFVEWQSADDGDRMRARRSGARGFVVENSIDGAIWHRSSLTHSDLTQPATLVEVTP